MSLLSSSPMLSTLFISYANRAAALESASALPSPGSGEWRALRDVITTLQEENEKLKLETREMALRLEAHKAFRSELATLKEVNATQQDDIESLQAELVEVEDHYDRFMVDSNGEKSALHVQVLDLEVRLQSGRILN